MIALALILLGMLWGITLMLAAAAGEDPHRGSAHRGVGHPRNGGRRILMPPRDGTLYTPTSGPFKGREYVWLEGKLCRVGKGAFRQSKPLNHPDVPKSIGQVELKAKAFQDG